MSQVGQSLYRQVTYEGLCSSRMNNVASMSLQAVYEKPGATVQPEIRKGNYVVSLYVA